jgi:hypothetical protein
LELLKRVGGPEGITFDLVEGEDEVRQALANVQR